MRIQNIFNEVFQIFVNINKNSSYQCEITQENRLLEARFIQGNQVKTTICLKI